jgi:hypothetical protein
MAIYLISLTYFFLGITFQKGRILESKALADSVFFGVQSFSFRRILESKALALGVF